MTLQTFQVAQLNYFKVASTVLNESPKILRQTFISIWDITFGHLPGFQLWDDSIVVRNLFLRSEGGKTKVPTDISYEEWDCKALFQVTIYAWSFTLPDSEGHYQTLSDLYIKSRKLAHGKFHVSVVSVDENEPETFALAIYQLRLLRNSICHSTSSEIVKATFDQHLQHAKDAFLALGVKADPIDCIGGLTESDLPTQEARKLEQAMKQETRAYVNFLEGISSDIEELLIRALSTAIKRKVEISASKEDLAVLEQKALENSQHALGDFSSALQSKQRALDIRFKLFGEEHPGTADSYHTLGDSQHALGDLSSALQCKQRALEIRLKLFGEEHSSTAESYHTLGDTQQAQGDFSSAL